MIYEKIIRPIFFRFDPEKVHNFVVHLMGWAGRNRLVRRALALFLGKSSSVLETKLGGLKLKNPVGLAAGFDKKVEALEFYPALGFGFAEIGSITNRPVPGNPKPRLWRITEDTGLIVYYGLYNLGAQVSKQKLLKVSQRDIPYGLSIAPTVDVPLEEMINDYLKTFETLAPVADYITFNVSCPNVASCNHFTQVTFIVDLIKAVALKKKEIVCVKEIFFKIGPDLSFTDLDPIIDACLQNGITGIVATNLVKNRQGIQFKSSTEKLNHPGGISGLIVQKKSDEIIRYIYKKSEGKLKIIGLGGILSAEDAYRKIRLGASAVQIFTGFIYNGPAFVRTINRQLTRFLKRDGFKNMSEAIGVDVCSE